MTLLELLVKELPGRGGWPEDFTFSAQDANGDVKFGLIQNVMFYNSSKWICKRGYDAEDIWGDNTPPEMRNAVLTDDYRSSIVTREQYEDYIAAQQTVWDGEGLPPVGIDVEFTLDPDKYSVQGIIPENGQVVNVVAHKQTTDGNPVAVVYWDERGAGRAAAFIKEAFSPIRTESDRKRDKALMH